MNIKIKQIINEEINKVINENINRKVKRLYFFDFDGTLVYTFGPEEGRKKYKEITGEEYPYEGESGWWNNPESIEPFDFSINQSIISQYREAKNDNEGISILLTNRDGELHNTIMTLLNEKGFEFDHYDYADQPNPTKKSSRAKLYLNKYPDVDTIKVYDDTPEQISDFKQMREDLQNVNIDVKIYKVK